MLPDYLDEMATIENGEAVIHYETFGEGPPVLALAPGGLRHSRIGTWANAPWNPIETLAPEHTVIGMDQRNTGTSFAPITSDDGWSSYAGDQLAVMDALGIDEFSVIGMCIGGAFIMRLLAEAPQRITAAVALQPVGHDDNRADFRQIFDAWRTDIAGDHPEADDDDWESCWTNLFGGDDILWSVPDAMIATIETPVLVCLGDDAYHPSKASRYLAEAAPNASLIERWKEPPDLERARTAVEHFLAEHST